MKQKHEDKMIRKARFKFVLGATVATFAAMLVLVISINLVRYVQVRRQQEETLQSLSRHEMAGPVGDAGHGVFFPDDAPPFPEYDGGGY
jgi:ammonia channel protein AmtB